jgi:YrbI family 3-deoxy-D-manno-octulosonate 8-phosphate phosphatase
MAITAALRKRLRRIKAVVLDCDGVLTDGRLYYGADGIALKAFDVKDGYGLVKLRDAGVRVAFVSADRAALLGRRAEVLGVADVLQGVREKADALRDFASQYLLDVDEIAYMGDDLNDLNAMGIAGVSFAPSDAVPAVRRACDHVMDAGGGRGAVRELAEMILAARRV